MLSRFPTPIVDPVREPVAVVAGDPDVLNHLRSHKVPEVDAELMDHSDIDCEDVNVIVAMLL
jgi:hypothetical protein